MTTTSPQFSFEVHGTFASTQCRIALKSDNPESPQLRAWRGSPEAIRQSVQAEGHQGRQVVWVLVDSTLRCRAGEASALNQKQLPWQKYIADEAEQHVLVLVYSTKPLFDKSYVCALILERLRKMRATVLNERSKVLQSRDALTVQVETAMVDSMMACVRLFGSSASPFTLTSTADPVPQQSDPSMSIPAPAPNSLGILRLTFSLSGSTSTYTATAKRNPVGKSLIVLAGSHARAVPVPSARASNLKIVEDLKEAGILVTVPGDSHILVFKEDWTSNSRSQATAVLSGHPNTAWSAE